MPGEWSAKLNANFVADVANLVLVMRHVFFRSQPAFAVLFVDFDPTYLHHDSFLHL